MAELSLRNLYVRPLLLSSTVFSVLALFLVFLNSFINLPRTSLFLGGYAVFAFIASLLLGMLYLDWLWKCQYVKKVDEINELRRELEAQRSQAEDFTMSPSQIESMGLDFFLKEDTFPAPESEVEKKKKRTGKPDPFSILGLSDEE
jgi:signal transduction histidine kinase